MSCHTLPKRPALAPDDRRREVIAIMARGLCRLRPAADEWKLRHTRPDNHWLDCLVGCAVAASIQGASLAGVESGPIRPRGRVRLSDIQRRGR